MRHRGTDQVCAREREKERERVDWHWLFWHRKWESAERDGDAGFSGCGIAARRDEGERVTDARTHTHTLSKRERTERAIELGMASKLNH